jgi:hypothetical protein
LNGARWSAEVEALDLGVMVATLLLAGITLQAASDPVFGTDPFFLLMLGWPVAGVGWALTLLRRADDVVARAAGSLLLAGTVAAFGLFGVSFLFLAFGGRVALAGAAVVAAGLFAVVVARTRNRRLAWLVAPTVVLLTLGFVYTGLPRQARLWIANSALTTYAEQIRRGDAVVIPRSPDQHVVVGTMPIYEVHEDEGELRFVTAYIGILGDDPAGLAYVPSGQPAAADLTYQHVLGPWYRWYPSAFGD